MTNALCPVGSFIMCPRLTNRLRVFGARVMTNCINKTFITLNNLATKSQLPQFQEWASALLFLAHHPATHKLASFCHIRGAGELKMSSVSFPPGDAGVVNAGWLRNFLPVKLTHFVCAVINASKDHRNVHYAYFTLVLLCGGAIGRKVASCGWCKQHVCVCECVLAGLYCWSVSSPQPLNCH